MERLCHRRYWTRLWVIQEVFLARKRTVHCGARSLAGPKFEGALETMDNQASIRFKRNLEMVKKWSFAFKGREETQEWKAVRDKTPAVEFFGALRVAQSGGVRKSSLRSLITSFHSAGTQDPRDLVYGLLALSAPCDGIVPDYSKTTFQLYTDVLKASVWDTDVEWNGPDHYLVSFSKLLQEALGAQDWDITRDSFIGTESCDEAKMIRVGGLLVQRIRLDDSFKPAPLESLKEKGHWPQSLYNTFSGTGVYQRFTALQGGKTIFAQKFLLYSYFTWPQEGGVLLSYTFTTEDYLCLFKNSDVAAVVRPSGRKTCGRNTFVVVSRAFVGDQCPPSSWDWMMKCDVEMSIETLMFLTI
jgi:hypothetical protein